MAQNNLNRQNEKRMDDIKGLKDELKLVVEAVNTKINNESKNNGHMLNIAKEELIKNEL